MFYVLQNESNGSLRRVPILLTDAATGTTAQTGVASTNIYPSVNINGGAFAGGAGTVGEAGYGQYYYEFDPSEVATLGLAGIHVTAVGCRDYDAICQVAAFNVYSAAGVGITAGDVWSYDISGISAAGSAGTQLNIAASGGAGLTAGDVWNYTLTSTGDSADLTLGTAKNQADNAASNTSSSQIRSNVWDFDIDAAGFFTSPPFAAGYLVNAGQGATTAGSQVWSYVLSDTNTAEADLVSAAAGGAGITAGDVWSYTLTSSAQSADATLGNVDTNVTTIQGNTSNIPGDVWAYVTRTLTSGSGVTAGDIWDYAGGRTITGGIVTSVGDKTGYSLSGTQSFNLTGNISGNISGSVGSVTNPVDITTNAMSGTAGSVWSYVTRTLTSGGGVTAGDIWSYATRTITGGLANTVTSVTNPVSISGATMASIANSVWDDTVAAHTTNGTFGKLVLRSDAANKVGDVTLYSAGGINGVDADVHRIANDTDAATFLKNALTGVGASWTGNITGNLTGSVNSVTTDVNVSTTSMSGIANTVWSAGTKTITGGTVDSVTNPVSVTTTSMSGIAQTAWTYSPRTLTAGAGATAGDIWNYQIDTITTSGSAAAQLNDAAVSGSVVTIVNGPYRVTSTAEGSDGVIDILADSIQPITIYCINGFAQPFNITGYTASVDIYDEAGGFVRSYTPTIDYALGGILTFNIDGDVTGTIGRYTLVVSLTDGDVIQLGPLTILVRPL